MSIKSVQNKSVEMEIGTHSEKENKGGQFNDFVFNLI